MMNLLMKTRLNGTKAMRSMSGKAFASDWEYLVDWLNMGETSPAKSQFDSLTTSLDESTGVMVVGLNRPHKKNAFDMQLWSEYEQVFQEIQLDKQVKCVVLQANGSDFTAGMDLNVFAQLQKLQETCEGRKREKLIQLIKRFQDIISMPEKCKVPVLAAVHGLCIGAGVDLITACDLRYCDASAEFSVKEVDLSIVADVGTIQRLPKVIGEQVAREMIYTGRHVFGQEAASNGLVLKCFKDKQELYEKVMETAAQIAEKSPLTIRGIKTSLNYQRDHSVEDSLHQVRHWNSSVLLSEDLYESMTAMASKTKPNFRKTE